MKANQRNERGRIVQSGIITCPNNARQANYKWGKESRQIKNPKSMKGILKMAVCANTTATASTQTNPKMQCARGEQRFPQDSSFAAFNCKLSCPSSALRFFPCGPFTLHFAHYHYLRSSSSTIITVILCLFGLSVALILRHKCHTHTPRREGRNDQMLVQCK